MRQTDVRRASSLNVPYPRGGDITTNVTSFSFLFDQSESGPLVLPILTQSYAQYWVILNDGFDISYIEDRL